MSFVVITVHMYILHVPFIKLSLALNILLYIVSAGFFVLLTSFAVQRKE